MCCDRYKGAALTFIVRLLHSEPRNISNTGVPPSTIYPLQLSFFSNEMELFKVSKSLFIPFA